MPIPNHKKFISLLCLTVILLSLGLPKICLAQLQELEVNPITHDGPIPVFRDYPNLAAVFVQSSLNNLSFESNLEIVEERGDPASGEYILLIEPVRQSIRVNAPGFMQGRIQVQNLDSRDVIYYSLEPNSSTEAETLPVVLRINPPNAEVFVDSEPVDATSSISLEPGLYTIELVLDGYHNLEQQIDVNDDNNFFELSMEEIEPVPVRIQTDPPGATVFVNGVRQAETDPVGALDFFHFPGTMELQLSLDGYVTQRDTVQVMETAENQFTYNLAENIGIISLQINPDEADVQLNGNIVDTDQPIEVEPGNYSLTVSLSRYESYEEELVVGLGETVERSITLQMNTGTLDLDVSPAEADIFVNKQEFDHQQPIFLAPGMYRLEVNMSNYEPHQQNILIERGETIKETVALTPYTGSLLFTVSPSFAQASLSNSEGKQLDQWTGIHRINDLNVGSYKINVQAQGYRSKNIDIQTQQDQRYEATVELEVGSDCPEYIYDIDNNQYPVVNIAGQCWMSENLRTSRYSNGDGILESKSNILLGAWSNYDDDPQYDVLYGKLYNWFAVVDGRNLCPLGWHVSSDSEWQILEEYLGMKQMEIANEGLRGVEERIGNYLKANFNQWGDSKINEIQRTEFSALPGGYRKSNSIYLFEGLNGYWWTSSDKAYIRKIGKADGIFREILPKQSGLSVRCIMN